jgi:hypothetical protein
MEMLESFFINPWMLAAAAAVLLPILIEWLFRWRRRQIELPTIRFLLRNKEQKRVRRQDRILLLLRMLGIFLLVLAIARPLLRHGLMGGTQQRNLVLLLDGTASTQQQVGVTTAFGLAQKKAAAMLREMPTGPSVTVLYLGDRPEVVVENETDLHTAAARVEGLRASSGASSITGALARVKDYVKPQEGSQPELYVFSDFQAHTWTRQGAGTMEASQLLGEVTEGCETFLVDVGGEPELNYMLTDFRPDEWLMSTGMPVSFRAVIETWGEPADDATATVTFLVDGVKKDVREARPAEGGTSVVFEHRFTRPGEYLVEAVLEGDEHRVDNRRVYLCTVPETVKVLVLDETAPAMPGNGAEGNGNGSPAAGAADEPEDLARESAFLARAIAPPSHPGMERVSRFSAKVIHPMRVDYENIDEYAAVVLADTETLSESLVSKLENYVADGGALWLFAGPRANLYQYNKLLFEEGKGLLPCRLVSTVAAQDAGAGGNPGGLPHIRFGESRHPALARLTGRGDEDARFLRYMELELKPDAQVVLALSNGAPALVEQEFGRGRVLVSSSTAGVDWTYLPATAEFPILVQELMRYLVGRPDEHVNLSVGDRFEQPVFVSTQHLLLRHPDGHKERLTPREREGREDAWVVSFDDTRQQGVYEFVDTVPGVLPRHRFVVNQEPEEGDLSRLSRGDVRDAFGGSWRWIGPEVPVEELAARLHTVTELAPSFLWALAAVLGIESLLAARFGRRRWQTQA